MESAVVAYDPRADLYEDMARDPEGHFHKNIGGDRRLPPWFGSEFGSAAPGDIQRRVHRFLADRCVGQPPDEFDIRHNWYDRQFEFSRWVPDFEEQDHDGRVVLVTWTPLCLYAWPEAQGWLPGGEALFDYLWECFLGSDADTRRRDRKRKEVEDAKIHVARMSSLISQGEATDAQLEEYEHYLQIADPAGWQATAELADEMRKPTIAMMDELGI